VAAAVLRRQRQAGQAAHWAACAQHRIRELEALVPAGGQARMELAAEPRQHAERDGPAPASAGKLSITAFVRDHAVFSENT